MIEAGTVHSLGGGVVVFEVQENSDATFRIYDWDHIDPKTGKPRPLQVDKALACIDFAQGAILPAQAVVESNQPAHRERLIDCSHFQMWRLESTLPFDVGETDAPGVLVCIDGGGTIEYNGARFKMDLGTVVLLPAELGVCRVRPSGSVTILALAVPEQI